MPRGHAKPLFIVYDADTGRHYDYEAIAYIEHRIDIEHLDHAHLMYTNWRDGPRTKGQPRQRRLTKEESDAAVEEWRQYLKNLADRIDPPKGDDND